MTELTPEQQARIAAAKRLWDLPYDGVVGTLPKWFPLEDQHEFIRIRSSLLRKYLPHYILFMIQDLAGSLMLPEEVEREGLYEGIPRRLRPDVYRLLKYKKAFDLGPVEGLDLLLGEENIVGNARAGSSYLERCRRGGAKGGRARRELSEFNHSEVIRKAKLIWMTNGLRRGLAGRIKKSGCSDLSVRQINNILRSEMN